MKDDASPQPELTDEERWEKFEKARKKIAKAFRPYVKEYHVLVKKLRAERFHLRCTTMMAPIQLEGRLPNGERFYFRCRHTTCSLRIAPSRGDPVAQPTWEKEVERWGWPHAGSLLAEEVESVFRELLAAYESRLEP